MTPRFDEVKATQAAALFLKKAGGELNYLALIKLLYKADRDAIRLWGMPITTDDYVSMKFGPVTSRIYDRIKSSANRMARTTIWSSHIRKSADDPNVVILESDPGVSELSPAEERLIEEIFAADGKKDRFALAEECHDSFPEWQDPGSSSTPIEIDDIIDALGLSEEEAAHVRSSLSAQGSAFRLAV